MKPVQSLRLDDDVQELAGEDFLREKFLAALDKAGFLDKTRDMGLMLWHLQRVKTRAGARLFLTFDLDDDGHEAETDERLRLLEASIAGVEAELSVQAAKILGLGADRIVISGRPVESCCGTHCQACLLDREDYFNRKRSL